MTAITSAIDTINIVDAKNIPVAQSHINLVQIKGDI